MNRSASIALLATGCLVAGAVGWSLGKQPGGAESSPPASERPVTSLPERGKGGVTRDYGAVATAPVAHRGERSVAEIVELLRDARRSTELGADPVALAIVTELAEGEVVALLPDLIALDPRPDAIIAAALGRWAETSPTDAVEWAFAKLDGPGLAAARSAIVASWAQADPPAALAWLREQLADAPRKGRYRIESDFNLLVHTWAQSDPAAALAAVIDQEQPGTYSKWWGFSRLAIHDDRRDEVFDLVLGIEDEAIRQKGVESLVGAWADDNPRAAAAWLDARGYTDRQTQWAVSQRFARADPEANADWLLARVTDETREQSINTAIAYWVRSDPQATGSWLERNNLIDDRTAGQLATGWASRDVHRAVGWALRVEAESQRPLAIGNVLQQARNTAFNRGTPYDEFDFEPYTAATGIDAEGLAKLAEDAQQRMSRRW